jgi:hypothetical protein
VIRGCRDAYLENGELPRTEVDSGVLSTGETGQGSSQVRAVGHRDCRPATSFDRDVGKGCGDASTQLLPVLTAREPAIVVTASPVIEHGLVDLPRLRVAAPVEVAHVDLAELVEDSDVASYLFGDDRCGLLRSA